ncbi:hypothetical protein AJ85_08865 [Alkalihalobacillus alcalophilus ATCC 27647 = CGMCC 1.3604]|uniref:Uncharacterized protein n=1 Tax=Alkalihalobacillus alcalophilus ATCC 27647 = CGMCC 1.3604 TaxID=1218173 RepID=A0A094WF38_ALKAL|nr:hypothetical protein BALCAV_0216540 [Alkalihalobacillus alcalophilus ATCC 27647 = CGMCC 1.3604]THG90782.1 hypothetical protein AJ85_08865 [Alkalihalobacillus alcalophilus ATCC 27647 = CGMCC 1.3604]
MQKETLLQAQPKLIKKEDLGITLNNTKNQVVEYLERYLYIENGKVIKEFSSEEFYAIIDYAKSHNLV